MSAQGKKRLKKRAVRKFVPIVFVLISVLSLSLFGTYKIISKSIASAFSPGSQDLSSQDIYSMVYVPNSSDEEGSIELGELYLFILNPGKGNVLLIKLPKEERIDASGKFGEETISNVLLLGRNSSNGDTVGGAEFLVRSLEYSLGLKIDRYIYSEGKSADVLSRIFDEQDYSITFLPKLILEVKDGMTTNFSVPEFFSLFEALRSSDVREVPFGNLEVELRKFVTNSEISGESKTVAVLNGSGLPGIASFGGRICENAGMRVIEVGNATKVYDKSVVIVDDADSLAALYLVRFFGFSEVIMKRNLSGFAEPAVDRADITMILGLDIAESL